MQVRDMMRPDGRVFLKSEWGQISDAWPCVSFTKPSVGNRLQREFVPGRDILIYVGTTSAETTKEPEHRSKLISAVTIEPKQILETHRIVPPRVWAEALQVWRGRWPLSMAVLDAANMIGPPFPDAREVIPSAYRSFARMANRGDVVEALEDERAAVMSLPVNRITLNLSEDVRAYIRLRTNFGSDIDKAVRQEVARMAQSIIDRVNRGGEVGVRINPLRIAPNISEMNALLSRKWLEQGGACALCAGQVVPGSKNPMLQASADRIDSANGAYDDANVSITHLACNLAKRDYSLTDFEDWLSVLRGAAPDAVVDPVPSGSLSSTPALIRASGQPPAAPAGTA